MAGNLAPAFNRQWFDDNGDPLAGGKIYTYQSGTTTPQATYTDSSIGTPHANPIVLDANGRKTGGVWLDPTLSYKFVVKTSADVTIETIDSVIGTLTADAVNTASIQDDAVTQAKIGDDAVGATQLQDDASTDGNRAVTTNHIRDANVTRAKLATGAQAKLTIQSKTTTFTASSDDDVYLCSASGGAYTASLPTAVGISGKVFKIVRTDNTIANALTIDPNASETIGGSATVALYTQNEILTIISDGSNWVILDHQSNITQSVTLTPSAGFGTTSNGSYFMTRRGDRAWFQGQFQNGTAAASAASIALPTGITLDTAKIGAGVRPFVGNFKRLRTGASGSDAEIVICSNSASTGSVFMAATSAGGVFEAVNGSTISGNSDFVVFWFEIPVSGWLA